MLHVLHDVNLHNENLILHLNVDIDVRLKSVSWLSKPRLHPEIHSIIDSSLANGCHFTQYTPKTLRWCPRHLNTLFPITSLTSSTHLPIAHPAPVSEASSTPGFWLALSLPGSLFSRSVSPLFSTFLLGYSFTHFSSLLRPHLLNEADSDHPN